MTESRDSVDALVVGAGPTGLTIAAELARRGLRIRLIDRQAEPSGNSRALAIQPRTLELFDLMGIVGPVLAEGLPISGVGVWSGDRQLVHITPEREDTPYPATIDLPQARTEAVLRDYLAGFGVQPEWGVELTGFEAGADAVDATLRHADGESELLRVPWMIGCDGARSTTRKALGWDFAGSTIDALFAVGDLRLSWSLPHDEIQIFFHAEGLLAVFPFGTDRQRVVVELEPPTDDALAPPPTLEDFQRWLDERGPAGTAVSDPAWLTHFRVSFRHAAHYRAGRVFLAGDAAHIHSPAGGQGMNTCIQDAINLAWKLALVQQHGVPEALLDSFEAERGPVAEEVLRRTHLISRISTPRGRGFDRIRAAALPVVGRFAAVQRDAANWVSQLDVNYRESPIVGQVETAGHRFGDMLRPGDRAPDAGPLRHSDGSTARLFDLLRHPMHTLLLFTGDSVSADSAQRLEAAAEVARRAGEGTLALVRIAPWASETDDSMWTDPDFAVQRRYGVNDASLVLIRPDGYIGFRAVPPDATALEQHLRAILGDEALAGGAEREQESPPGTAASA